MQAPPGSGPAHTRPPFFCLTRGREGFELSRLDPTGPLVRNVLQEPAASAVLEWSADGRVLCVGTPAGFDVYARGAGGWARAVQVKLEAPLVALQLSSRGRYVLALVRPPAPSQAAPAAPQTQHAPNVLAFETLSGRAAGGFYQRLGGREHPAWPPLSWSADEAVWARVVADEVQFGAGADLARVVARVKEERVRRADWAPAAAAGAGLRLALTSAEERGRGAPGRVRALSYPALEALGAVTFFRADEIQTSWAPGSAAALLVQTHTEVDASGKSYYGETKLYHLQCAQSKAEHAAEGAGDAGGSSGQVELPREGPIHAACWAPSGKQFAVLYGFMPARVSCFNRRGALVLDLAQGAYNTAAWSACSRLLAVGGLGNVRGPISLWDTVKMRRLAEISTTATTFAFSPTSRVLLTAVLSPRLRVDNGFKLWSYDGRLLQQLDFAQLFAVAFLPEPGFHAPPPSPRLYDAAPSSPDTPAAPAAAPASSSPAPGKYRHPNAAAAPAALLRQEPVVSAPKKYKPPAARSQPESAGAALPPGYAPAAPAKKKKPRKKKAADAAVGAGEETEEAEPEPEAGAEEDGGAQAAPETAPAPAASAGAADGEGEAGGAAADPEKRAKALQKKLRQIAALQAEAAGGKQLSAEQQEKVAQEGALRAQLDALTKAVADSASAGKKKTAP